MRELIYRALRDEHGPHLFIDEGQGEHTFEPDHSWKVKKHSRAGFEWGYLGSGPAQLALGILLRETSPDEAIRRHLSFKSQVISQLPAEGWQLNSSAVQGWLQADREEHPLKEDTCSY